MDFFKRYAISFSIAGIILYFFTIWVEEQNEGMMPHNLSNKAEEKLAVTLPPKRYYEKCLDVSETQQLIFNFRRNACIAVSKNKGADFLFIFYGFSFGCGGLPQVHKSHAGI